jgi:hypothetical protein
MRWFDLVLARRWTALIRQLHERQDRFLRTNVEFLLEVISCVHRVIMREVGVISNQLQKIHDEIKLPPCIKPASTYRKVLVSIEPIRLR